MSEFWFCMAPCVNNKYCLSAGARQVVTGLAQLRRQSDQVLCTSMCIGSGMGAAAVIVNEVL